MFDQVNALLFFVKVPKMEIKEEGKCYIHWLSKC